MFAHEILGRKGSDVATVTPESSIAAAIGMLRDHNVGALVVSADGRAVAGIISERDVVRHLADEGAAVLDRQVSELMNTDVAACSPDDHVDALMNLMTERRIRHLPVLVDGALAGLVSIGDIVKSRVDELEAAEKQLVEYIRTGR
jgi:CBS domain-containing protein